MTPNSDKLLAELEDSIPQGQPNATAYAADDAADDPDFGDLEALLHDSLQDERAKAQHKKDLEARKRGFVGMSAEEVAFCNSRMEAFEMAREWEARASYAVFQRFCCTNCGSVKTVFSRYMELHRHRRNPTARRWLAVQDTKFHPECVVEERTVPLCVDCGPREDLDTHNMRPFAEILK